MEAVGISDKSPVPKMSIQRNQFCKHVNQLYNSIQFSDIHCWSEINTCNYSKSIHCLTMGSQTQKHFWRYIMDLAWSAVQPFRIRWILLPIVSLPFVTKRSFSSTKNTFKFNKKMKMPRQLSRVKFRDLLSPNQKICKSNKWSCSRRNFGLCSNGLNKTQL